MIDHAKKIIARFYVNATGRKPVREWLLELSKEDRGVIGKDIQKVEIRMADRDALLPAGRARPVGSSK